MQRELETSKIQRALRGRRIAFIGCGVMAEAIISILLRGEMVEAGQIVGSEPVEARRRELAARYQVEVVEDNRAAASSADLVLLTVKPQTLPDVMRGLAGTLEERQIVVSIVPGATLKQLSEGLRHRAVVRSMPNT